MFTKLIYLFIFVSPIAESPIFAAVAKQVVNSCSPTEFPCGDGGCVSAELVCDGTRDCADGLDETGCGESPVALFSQEAKLHRYRRQASGCRRNQWQCRDGSCIPFDGKCDGVVDCRDSSDETHALCRNNVCQQNWFRCTYGACVDGTAPCNGNQECADNSDELLPRCRNETDEVRGTFKCVDGSRIPAASHCDGTRDCPDGSDETVRSCAAKTCPSYLFQCAYGACVDSDANCNQIQDCADGSDEAADLCDKSGTAPITPIKPPSGNCVLPSRPDRGNYISNVPNGKPGEAYQFLVINVTCQQGYGVVGPRSISCYNGYWPEPMPKCVSLCHLMPHPSVEYNCQVTEGGVTGTRICREYEPHGTVVIPRCQTPNYYSPTELQFMQCIQGIWDYVAICIPECGTVTPGGEQLVVGGESAKRGEIPWHAGIYTKAKQPYMQICGGSLISTSVIISAAHCFWSNLEGRKQPETNFAVAVGKVYRPWNNAVELEESQRSDVKELHLPQRFQGNKANYQEDIAVVIVVQPFVYKVHIRPVCVDFGIHFEARQLQPGNMGKVAGWGLTSENGVASQVLKVIDLPYVDVQTCISETPEDFRELITSDKICAGVKDSTKALCKGDSGGGLAFPEPDRGKLRYYLRGVVSTAPSNENICNTYSYTTFTQVIKHEHFIKQYWKSSL